MLTRRPCNEEGKVELQLRFRPTDLLQEVNEFLHARLLARGPEYFFLERPLLVELEQHHLEISQINTETLGLGRSISSICPTIGDPWRSCLISKIKGQFEVKV